MPPVSTAGLPQQQTVMQKLTMGAIMGTGVGCAIGAIGATVQIFRAGPGPRGIAGTFAQFMGTSAATFGFFMSIGTVIRTEGNDQQMRALAARPEGLRVIREEMKRKAKAAA